MSRPKSHSRGSAHRLTRLAQYATPQGAERYASELRIMFPDRQFEVIGRDWSWTVGAKISDTPRRHAICAVRPRDFSRLVKAKLASQTAGAGPLKTSSDFCNLSHRSPDHDLQD